MYKRQVLEHCSLELASGSILGLIGINGAGKSTLLHCISGAIPVDEGTIKMCIRDRFTEEDLRSILEFKAACGK